MEKFLKSVGVSLIATFLLMASVMPIHADEGSENILTEFEDMQNRITESLMVGEDGYSYNFEKVKSIVFDFDFESLNKEIGTTFTNESFLEIAIQNIENAVVQPPTFSSRLYSCGISKSEHGWNYNREYATASASRERVSEMHAFANDSRMLSLIAKGNAKLSGAGYGQVLLYGIGYWKSFVAGNATKIANAINAANYNNCGTVTDINLFTLGVTSTNQTKH